MNRLPCTLIARIHLLKLLAASFFALLVLAGCGGGGSSNEQTNSDNNKLLSINLAGAGNVNIGKVPLPSLPADLIPVGTAFKVELEEPLTELVEIRHAIPVGENTGSLAIVRIKSSGTITLLQTRVENNQLIALTPGFSKIVIARLENQMALFKPENIGPDVLPVGVGGQYHENGFKGIPGLARIFHE